MFRAQKDFGHLSMIIDTHETYRGFFVTKLAFIIHDLTAKLPLPMPLARPYRRLHKPDDKTDRGNKENPLPDEIGCHVATVGEGIAIDFRDAVGDFDRGQRCPGKRPTPDFRDAVGNRDRAQGITGGESFFLDFGDTVRDHD